MFKKSYLSQKMATVLIFMLNGMIYLLESILLHMG
jgi:hypothetical protein